VYDVEYFLNGVSISVEHYRYLKGFGMVDLGCYGPNFIHLVVQVVRNS